MTPPNGPADDDLERVIRRALQLPDAPADLVRRATGLWPTARPNLQTAATFLRRIAAVLSFDSAASSQLAFGVRSAKGGTRHLLFTAQERDIDVRVNSDSVGFAITGQVLGPDLSGTVELQPEPETDMQPGETRRVELDDLGEFRIDGLEAGRYVLKLLMPATEIVLPAIEVGEPRS